MATCKQIFKGNFHRFLEDFFNNLKSHGACKIFSKRSSTDFIKHVFNDLEPTQPKQFERYFSKGSSMGFSNDIFNDLKSHGHWKYSLENKFRESKNKFWKQIGKFFWKVLWN